MSQPVCGMLICTTFVRQYKNKDVRSCVCVCVCVLARRHNKHGPLFQIKGAFGTDGAPMWCCDALPYGGQLTSCPDNKVGLGVGGVQEELARVHRRFLGFIPLSAAAGGKRQTRFLLHLNASPDKRRTTISSGALYFENTARVSRLLPLGCTSFMNLCFLPSH